MEGKHTKYSYTRIIMILSLAFFLFALIYMILNNKSDIIFAGCLIISIFVTTILSFFKFEKYKNYKVHIILPILFIASKFFSDLYKGILIFDESNELSPAKFFIFFTISAISQIIIYLIYISKTDKNNIQVHTAGNIISLCLYLFAEFYMMQIYILSNSITASYYFYKLGCLLFYITIVLFSYRFNKKNNYLEV